MVKVYHVYEATNASSVAGSRKFANHSCSLGIDVHSGWRNQVSQEGNLLHGKHHLLKLNCQPSHSEAIQR